MLISIDRFDEAMESLQLVVQLAPKEPTVYALLGQVYHRLGRTADALNSFNIAIDLDPKEAASLKVNSSVAIVISHYNDDNYAVVCVIRR